MDAVLVQLSSLDFIMAVKSAVNTEIIAVIRDIDRCEHADRVAKMLSRLHLRLLCNLFQERQSRRGQQSRQILRCAGMMVQRAADVFCSVRIIVIGFPCSKHIIQNR